jgi:hypothetical protein
MATREQRDDRLSPRLAAAYDVVLAPDESLPGRPSTDPGQTRDDLRVMAMMVARERDIAATWSPAIEGPGISERTSDGTRYLLAVPDGRALLTARDVTAVGFFGRLRDDVDHRDLFEHERRITQLFPGFAPLGFLSYFDLGPEHGQYGNLVLFWTPDVPPEWHAGKTHREAAAIAPRHYHHIRLHRGRIPGPFMGNGSVELVRTQYLDFSGSRPWRALRTYS